MPRESLENLLVEGQKVNMFVPQENEPFTVIVENVKDNGIEISAPLSRGYYVPLELGGNVELMVGCRHGLYKIPFKISGREAGLFNSLKLEPIGDIDKIQRRQLVRMEIFIEFDLEFIYGTIYKPPSGFKILRGKRGNLSGSGIFFWSNKPLPIDMKLNVRLNLEPHYNRPVIAQAKVVRVDINRVQNDLFGIALEFESIREGDRDKIISYVLHKERALINRDNRT